MMTASRLLGRAKGSITVFLSLTGILVMALLGTLLETARYTVCENHAGRTTRTAAEALFTEYSRPLYENYGLFFIEDTGTPFEKVISRYAGDTMEGAGRGDMDFLRGEIRQIEVTDKTYAGDYGAGPLQKEIRQYMMRSLTEKQLEKFVKRREKLASVEKRAEEIEELVEEEKKEGELDRQLLELMKMIDGISIKNGKISCGKVFVKMFVTGEKKGQDFGVTQACVWKKMKKRLDDTPVKWEKLDPGKFKKRVEDVLKLTKSAEKKAEQLRQAYGSMTGQSEFADHREKAMKLLNSMSALRVNEKILQESSRILGGTLTEESREQLKVLWKDYDTKSIAFDYTGVSEKGGAENPLDSLGAGWGNGILNLVCSDVKNISGACVDSPDHYAKFYREEDTESEDCGKKVDAFADDQSVSLSGAMGNMGIYGMDEFCLDTYISEKFGSYVKKLQKEKTWKKALAYPCEYIVSGRSSDRENLKSVLERILLIRTVVNFTAIYKDAGKKAQAYELALAIVGFSGMEPLVRLTQTLILILWSLVEGMVDVAGLLQERNVPLAKSPSQVLTNIGQLFAITNAAIVQRAKKFGKAKEKSFGYQEYLLLFLACMRQSTRRYRVMDLIQWDMVKNGYSYFELGTCVFSIDVSAGFSFPSRFFRMAVIEKMLGRDVREISSTCKITQSYV